MTMLGQKHSHCQHTETAFSRADAETPWAVLAQACESRPIGADWAFCEEGLKDTGNDNRAFRQRERRHPN